MWLNIFKISIILSVIATALGESIFEGILTELIAKDANTLTYGDKLLLEVLAKGVVGMPDTSTPADLDEALRVKIVKFLIVYMKKNACTRLGDSLFQYTYNVLFEHSEITTASFIKLWGKSYYLSDKKVTWYKANKTCVDMGASLISQEKNDESTLLLQFLKVNFDRTWWVSFNQKLRDSLCPLFIYQNGMNRVFVAGMHCTDSYHFICEK